MNKLILLLAFNDHSNSVLELKKLVSELESLSEHSWKVITLDYLSYKKLREKNIMCNFIDDYFFEEDHYYDYSQAIKISNQWFLDTEGNDATIYRGISIGVILQGWINLFFSEFLCVARTAEKILKEENPDEIWLCFSRSVKDGKQIDDYKMFMDVFSALARNRNIVCKEKLLFEKTKGIQLSKELRSILQECKLFLYSRAIRKTLFLIKYCLLVKRNKKTVNILLPSPQAYNYIGETTIDGLLKDEQKNVFIWRGETTKQRVNLIDISPPLLFKMRQSNKRIISNAEKRFSDYIEASDIAEIGLTLDILKQIFKQRIRPLMKGIIYNIEQLESFFRKINIQLLFSHTDTAMKERTLVSVANKYKVPSLILQHGYPGHYRGFFPFIATKFAAWGKAEKDWFEKNGVDKDRIYITGAANFDSYVQRVRSSKRDGRVDWHGMSDYLLYIMGPNRNFSTEFKSTKQDNDRLINDILKAVETVPEKLLVIKLRPGDPQIDFYRSEIKRRGLKNVCLVDLTDNGKLLNACGVVLITYSTMALEALFFEKPIIQLKYTNKKKLMKALYHQSIICDEEFMPLSRYGAALGVENPEELEKAIVDIYENKKLRQSIIDEGKIFLRKYAFEPDGKASLRVIQYIDKLIQQGVS